MDKLVYHFASFNLRYDNPHDGENGWAHRKANVLDMVRHYGWDAIGMQEVCGSQLDDLSSLSDYSHEGIGRENDRESEHVPIFYKKQIFRKEDGGTFWLSTTPGRPSKSWGSDCKRICTWVKLRDGRNGKRFIFVNTHLDHVSEEARFQGARIIAGWIAQHASGLPVILTGDFNASPDERCYREIIAAGLADARRAAEEGHYGPTGTFTGFDYAIPWEKLKEIDHIFVNRHVRVRKTRTVVDSFDRKYPSDHFPITAEVLL